MNWTCGKVLLRVRRQAEEAARQDFLRARAGVNQAEQRLAGLAATMDAHDGAARESLLAGAGDLAFYRRSTKELRGAIAHESGALAGAEQQLERQRDELMEARRQRRAISCLHDKFLRQAARAETLREARLADDAFATYQAFVKKGESK